MALTDVDVCNRALQQIGSRATIQTLAQDSEEAQNCNLLYTDVRDLVLSMAWWNFARKTDVLALLKSAPGTPENPGTAVQWDPATMPAPPWLYEYTYPADCIQFRYLIGRPYGQPSSVPLFGSSTTWNMPGSIPQMFAIAVDANVAVILTNTQSAIGTYTQRVTNPAAWPLQFTRAVVTALAAHLAMPLTKDKDLQVLLFKEANSMIVQARVSDGNESFTIQDVPTDWITMRGADPGMTTGAYVSPYPPLFAVA